METVFAAAHIFDSLPQTCLNTCQLVLYYPPAANNAMTKMDSNNPGLNIRINVTNSLSSINASRFGRVAQETSLFSPPIVSWSAKLCKSGVNNMRTKPAELFLYTAHRKWDYLV
jgi:hypothetical protein